MTKIFWTIPSLAIYLYAITILTQFGFGSYFGIPSAFVEASITANTVYFYILAQAMVKLVIAIKWWWILIVFISYWILKVFDENQIKYVAMIFMLISIYFFVSFGNLLASTQTNFLTLPNGCLDGNSSQRYVVPVVYQGEGIIVPIDENNKMSGGFIVKDLSELNCRLKHEEVGSIK